MRAGTLKDRVEIQQRIESRNALGELELTGWTTLATIWANVEPLRGVERFAAEQAKGEVTLRVTARYMRTLTLTPKHRILFHDRPFDVESVIDVGGDYRQLEILCKEAT